MFLKAVSELMIDREALIDDGRVLHHYIMKVLF